MKAYSKYLYKIIWFLNDRSNKQPSDNPLYINLTDSFYILIFLRMLNSTTKLALLYNILNFELIDNVNSILSSNNAMLNQLDLFQHDSFSELF